jgi:hypothetical protein
MKIFFIAATLGTVYLIRISYRKTYDDKFDTFRTVFVIVPSLLLALVINEEFSTMEVCLMPLPSLGPTEFWQRSTPYNMNASNMCISDARHIVICNAYRIQRVTDCAALCRCFGHSRSISRQSPSSRNSSFSSERARQITSPRSSSHAWARTVRCTC